MFIIPLLFLLTSSQSVYDPYCVELSCAQLEPDQCAKIEDGKLYVNSSPCSDIRECSLEDMLLWYQEMRFSNKKEANYGCVNDLEGLDYLFDHDDIICGERDPGEDFVDGAAPKKCQDSSDCLLKNGETTKCVCGSDGDLYCQYPNGNSAFDGFWEQCNEQKGKVTARDFVWNTIYVQLYVQYLTAPDCAMDLFKEFQFLEEGLSWASSLALITLYNLL